MEKSTVIATIKAPAINEIRCLGVFQNMSDGLAHGIKFMKQAMEKSGEEPKNPEIEAIGSYGKGFCMSYEKDLFLTSVYVLPFDPSSHLTWDQVI